MEPETRRVAAPNSSMLPLAGPNVIPRDKEASQGDLTAR
eukprot:CAMPEP_0174895496 /NCGR_PEP_ID=MMETSP0167-20121228/9902_1 /TAXON_ID=38298 /ORGANISM="Rhodella maculata, Strain CCMP736" /LENGTH=38 /DNA_ID= /DNA_START= /DNA_END= /DNA_ORIENTATION=